MVESFVVFWIGDGHKSFDSMELFLFTGTGGGSPDTADESFVVVE